MSTDNIAKVNCLVASEGKKSNEVYLPFSFIKSYFDVSESSIALISVAIAHRIRLRLPYCGPGFEFQA